MMIKTENFHLNVLVNGLLGMLIGGVVGGGMGAASGATGGSILTNAHKPSDINQLMKIGATGGSVLLGSVGLFNGAGQTFVNSITKINIDTIPLHFIITEILVCLVGFALLQQDANIADTILAFAIGSAVLAYPFMLASWISRKCCCPQTITEPEEIPLTNYGSV